MDSVSRNQLYRTLKKLALCTLLSIVSYVVMAIVGIYVIDKIGTENELILEMSSKMLAIFANYFLMIMTFNKPRKILLAPCK